MGKYEVTTTTGSKYYIDHDTGWWTKNNGIWAPLTRLATGEWDGTRHNVPDITEWAEVEKPEPGKNMYIQGRGMHDWWLTTPVVSVEEVEEWA